MNDHSAFTQLLSVGVLWIAFHCAGMCGPIVGGAIGGGARSHGGAVWGLLQYQLGRMVGLGVIGAVVGGVGGVVGVVADSGGVERVGGAFALVMATVLLFGVLHDSRAQAGLLVQIRHQHGTTVRARVDRAVVAVADHVGRVAQRLQGRPIMLGLTLSLLPCMIVVWALSLSATTQSAWDGALVMILLVAMTTLPLLLAVIGVRGAFLLLPWPWLRKVPPLVSGLWLVAVGLAALGVIDHAHVVVDVFGPRTVMLW